MWQVVCNTIYPVVSRVPTRNGQTPAQSRRVSLMILCKHITPKGLANNTRQQMRGCVTNRDNVSDFESSSVCPPCYIALVIRLVCLSTSSARLDTRCVFPCYIHHIWPLTFFFRKLVCCIHCLPCWYGSWALCPILWWNLTWNLQKLQEDTLCMANMHLWGGSLWGPRHHLDCRDWNGKNVNILDAPLFLPAGYPTHCYTSQHSW